ncbi:MAG: nucleotide sugar dehydrogenase [Acidimicrobiales bacterium]|nr:nucleotide sugar dehydrogenase [Acidimicrobiales bacterium]
MSELDLVIVGLGYVGLPLAQEAVASGLQVTGFDVSTRAVDGLNNGSSHVDDLSDDDIATMLAGGFSATTDPACIAGADVVVICVPTPLRDDTTPDLGAVESSAAAIAANLTAGTLVVLESTTYPGTTDDVVRPILESGSGLTAGTDFALAYSPERIDPGNPQYGLRNTPKVVGGYTDACTERAVAFYGQVVDTVVPTVGTREAEMAKLLENTYRHVNIALVNEMAIFSHDLDIDLWAAIDAAKTKPFGFQAFYPGPGVGGHCIPIDPNYLSYAVRSLGYQFRFVELAQEVSGRMPAYVAARIQTLLNDHKKPVNGSKVLLLGVTYKADISDERETPARPLVTRLQAMGADVSFFDPHVERFEVNGQELPQAADLNAAIADADVVVLVQTHSQILEEADFSAAAAVLDTRGALEGPNIVRL